MMDQNISTYIHEKGTVVNTKGHKLLKFVTIEDGVAEILESAQTAIDFDTTLGEFVAGLQSTKKVVSENGEFVLTSEGFNQLVKDRLTYPPSAFSHKGLTEATKLSMLGDLVKGEKGLMPITVRTSKGPDGREQVDGIVSSHYSFFDNKTLAMTILNMSNQGLLPDTAQFMTLGIAPRAVDMRIVSGDWNFKLGENGHSQNFMGNLVINNQETGKGALGVRAAVTRWECLNSTIGSSIFQMEHRYSDYNEFLNLLGQGVSHIRKYADEMMEQMNNFRSIQTASPMLIFAKVGEELGIPKYALEGVEEYWRDTGSGDTLYDVVQSVAAGVQQVTAVKGKRLPNWGERARIEERVWDLALRLREMHEDGAGLDHYLECKTCHQKLPEPKEVVLN
jgi:hypothetical protein